MKLWPTPPPKITLIYDIGSSTIGASLVTLEKEKRPIVHYTIRRPIAFQKQIEPEKLIFAKKNALKEATEIILNTGIAGLKIDLHKNIKIHDIYCVLGAPWYVSKTSVIKVEKPESFDIDKNTVDTLIEHQEEEFKKSIQKEGEDLVTILEKKIVHAKADGYDVRILSGRKMKSLELSIFLSLAENKVLAHIKEVLRPFFSFKKIHFHSFPLAYFSTARDMFPQIADFLSVDIRGELTEISLVQRGVLVETVSFPLGRHSLIRMFAEKLGFTPEVALSFLKLYVSGKVERAMKIQMQKVIELAEKDWRLTFDSALSEISTKTLIPNRIFVASDFDIGNLYAAWIKTEKIDRLGIASDFHVEYIDEIYFAKALSWSRRSIHDSFLALSILFINKII